MSIEQSIQRDLGNLMRGRVSDKFTLFQEQNYNFKIDFEM